VRRQVNRAIDSIIREEHITVILAAHRLSSIARAERVMVIEDGIISEEGRYDVLVSVILAPSPDTRIAPDVRARTSHHPWLSHTSIYTPPLADRNADPFISSSEPKGG
jgi:ABC-type glutathione transport system ATPase component